MSVSAPKTQWKILFLKFRQIAETQCDPQEVYLTAQKNYFIKSFKLQKINFQKAAKCFGRLAKKYSDPENKLQSNQWYKNQRKLFIQILIWYCHINKTVPSSMSIQEWNQLSQLYFNKCPMFLKFQGLSLMKNGRKVVWMKQDDELLQETVKKRGEGNWNDISKIMFYETQFLKLFAPKQCRQRWLNHLSERINHDKWTDEQDSIILRHVLEKSRRWCQIVKALNGKRTEHMVKNRYMCLVNPEARKDPKMEEQFILSLLSRKQKFSPKVKNTGIEIKQVTQKDNTSKGKIKIEEMPKLEGSLSQSESSISDYVKQEPQEEKPSELIMGTSFQQQKKIYENLYTVTPQNYPLCPNCSHHQNYVPQQGIAYPAANFQFLYQNTFSAPHSAQMHTNVFPSSYSTQMMQPRFYEYQVPKFSPQGYGMWPYNN